VKQPGTSPSAHRFLCLLPKKSPWLNPIELKWIHGKGKVVEPKGCLTPTTSRTGFVRFSVVLMSLIYPFPRRSPDCALENLRDVISVGARRRRCWPSAGRCGATGSWSWPVTAPGDERRANPPSGALVGRLRKQIQRKRSSRYRRAPRAVRCLDSLRGMPATVSVDCAPEESW
jgi:hypothetical protein